ncbi:MAG: hypothetical protein CML29_04175 [Rhizobiales bacterium]|nr:hypothetical protein [Hyphomicrobiales bacterium]MBA68525.1 hypothetical protein [Hyphomicrobiales bacterium]|tara:strand:+ start:80 stop:604 length:525 start_codon:yes stop_codon:yes gene_type:complete
MRLLDKNVGVHKDRPWSSSVDNDNASRPDDDGPRLQRSPRSRVFKGAHAAFNHEFSSVPCTVKDLSDTGAKIIFEDGFLVPDKFTLFIEVDGIKIDCERVWTKGRSCGVRFTGAANRTGLGRPQIIDHYDAHGDGAASDTPMSSQNALSDPGRTSSGQSLKRPHSLGHFGKRGR